MFSTTKTVTALVIAQAVCLALGLWIQDRLVMACARWDAGHEVATVTASSIQSPIFPAGQEALSETGSTATDAAGTPLVARWVGFVWISSLQGAIAYLFFSHLGVKHTKSKMQAADESVRHVKEIVRTRDAVVFGLAKLAESRDSQTGQHLERVAAFSTRLAAALRRHPRYRDKVTASFVRSIGVSSALHDIGKVGVQDSILLKPGRLTPDERFRMQVHPTIGGECIREIELRLGSSNFLQVARGIAFCHHEHWDGSGYPAGLAGEEIPLAARIVAIADVYDALSTRRIYKERLDHEMCVEMIHCESGKHFDPGLVEVFLRLESQFRDIAANYSDDVDAAGNSDETGGAAHLTEQEPQTAETGRENNETAVSVESSQQMLVPAAAPAD